MRFLPNLPLSHNVLSQSTRTDNLHRVRGAYTMRRDPSASHLRPPQSTRVDTLRRDSLPFYLRTSRLRLAQLCKPKGSPKMLLFKPKTNQPHFEKQLSYPPPNIDIRRAPEIARVTHSVQTRWMIHRLAVFLNIVSLITLNKCDSRRNLACHLKVTPHRMLFLWTLYFTSF